MNSELGACEALLSHRRRWLAAGLALWATRALATSAVTSTPPPTMLWLTRIAHGPEMARMEAALREAYASLGVTVGFVDMPAARAMLESNAGRTDGETARIAGIDIVYGSLRRVDVPLYINTNSIFVFGAGKAVPASLTDLSRLARVGIVNGWKTSEEATAGWKNVVRVSSFASALQMLKRDRLDAFLGRTEDTVQALRQEGLRPADFPSKVVLRAPLFHYLHEKHQALLPAITQELLKLRGKRPAVVNDGES